MRFTPAVSWTHNNCFNLEEIMSDRIGNIIKELAATGGNMFGKDFLLTWEKSQDELKQIVLTTEALKAMHVAGISSRVYDSGLAISQFRDNSTRTRFSFASACNLLGLEVQDLDESRSQIAHGEMVRETANMISFLSDVIGIRDDMYLGAGNAYMREVGEALDEGFENEVLHQRPSIINLQCDIDHPTQTMADLCWLKEHFGGLDKLKGKKMAMTWAYSPSYGKPLSVPQGIIGLMTRFGMDVSLAHPEGYALISEVIEVARKNAAASGGSFNQVASMQLAFQDADIVYPKSWAPYTVMQRRTDLLRAGDQAALNALEEECLAGNALFKDWECTEEKMALTRAGEALYMHCLPADISGVSCKQGEVTDAVFEKYRISTYREAGYKPFVIAAMILTSCFEDVAGLLGKFMDRNTKRIFS